MPDFTNAPSSVQGQIREIIGDDDPDLGILPNGSNLTDKQILRFYAEETSHVGRGAARSMEYVATKWASMATSHRTGPEDETNKSYQHFSAEAKRLRNLHGYYGQPGRTRRRSGYLQNEVIL